MLFRPVGSGVPHLMIFSAANAETALVHFKHGLVEPGEFDDVQMVPLTLEDVENELHRMKTICGDEFKAEDGAVPPLREEVSGQIQLGAEF